MLTKKPGVPQKTMAVSLIIHNVSISSVKSIICVKSNLSLFKSFRKIMNSENNRTKTKCETRYRLHHYVQIDIDKIKNEVYDIYFLNKARIPVFCLNPNGKNIHVLHYTHKLLCRSTMLFFINHEGINKFTTGIIESKNLLIFPPSFWHLTFIQFLKTTRVQYINNLRWIFYKV